MRAGLFVSILAASWLVASPAFADAQNSEVVTVGSDKYLRWYGHAGRTYFIQVSDPNDHLRKWVWAPNIETGNDEDISYEVDGTADKGFYRLWFSDQPTTDPDGDDFDGDGLSNLDEVTLYQTNPLNADTDGDGLLDGWEVAHGLDPNDDGTVNINNGASGDPDHDGLTNEEEQDLGTDPNDADSDDDGSWDGDENDGDTDPNDPNDAPESGWVILTGDSAIDVPKNLNRTLTIPAGESRVIVVLVASEEYDYYTDPETTTDFNDTLTWNIQPSDLDPLEDSIDVNARDGEWDTAVAEERTFRTFDPVHIESGMTITAPDDSPLVVEIDLTATNIGDGTLPSTVMVGLLPVVPVELFPQLLDGDGVTIEGSENPRTAPGQTNGMTEEDPVANRIAHREIHMRIVDGEILEGKQLTWSMAPLFVPPAGGDPDYRGDWANSTTHTNRYETAVHFGANGFESFDQATAHTDIDENGETAIRTNLAPVGFNKGRLRIEVEDFEGDPAKVADMEVPAVVVVDPGHGGTDSGNQSGGFDEKNLTLDYVQSTRDQLVIRFLERQPFHRVIITRNNDASLANIDRPQTARDEGADVFLSIHFNDGGTTARGAETLIRGAANVNQGEDQALAGRIQDAAVAAVGFTRTPGVKDYSPSDPSQPSTWMVLRDDQEAFRNTTDYHPIRGCIQEVDFMSNPTALNAITDATNGPILRANYASGVSAAIITDHECPVVTRTNSIG